MQGGERQPRRADPLAAGAAHGTDSLKVSPKAGGPEAMPMSQPDPLREALEQALVENPDDLAAHSAYADYLVEQGDPRGEFIQVQLALERPLPGAERKRLHQREEELLAAHEREWLGELAPLLLGTAEEQR